jgi:putative ABC transport system permease protein
VIDETMAARYWPGADPLGKRVTFDVDAEGRPIYRTVVGVARNVRHYEVGAPSRIQAYVPLAQSGRSGGTTMRLLLKAAGDPAALIAPLRALVKAHDAEAPVFQIETLDAFVDQQLARSRAMAAVLGGFAAAALALAALGIFGVMSYAVLQRRREIGIRMALGADRARIVRVVGSQAVRLTLAGLVIGMVGAAALTRVLGAALYEVDPLDPGVLLRVAGLLALAALGAATLPTLRATRARPAEVLADEG